MDCKPQTILCGLMMLSLAGGCVLAPGETAVASATGFVEDDARVVLEGRPSPTAAALLATGARYRVVLAEDDTLALAIVTPDRRIIGRMRIAAGAGPHASPAVQVEWEEHGGRTARVEAWASPGGLRGRLFVGDRSAAWRVRLDVDGSLAGEGWSLPKHGPASEVELAELRRARAIGADLRELTDELSRRAVIDDRRSCELAERIAMAELALELGHRAWTGHGRARLPVVGADEDPCPL